MINENEEELSIQQKAHLNVKAFSNTGKSITFMTIAFMALASSLVIYDTGLINNILAHIQIISIHQKNKMATISLVYNKNDLVDLLSTLGYYHFSNYYYIFMIFSAGIIFWELYRGRGLNRKFKEWDKEYLYRMYLVVFETSIPHGKTSGEKVLHLARSVFPELRYDYPYLSPSPVDKIKRLWKKSKTDQEIVNEGSNYFVGSYLLNLAVKTSAGYFIVKDFGDNIVKLQDIKQLISVVSRLISSRWGYERVFRIVCIAKEYDKPFLQKDSLEKEMSKEIIPLRHKWILPMDFPVDLLVKDGPGYSILWID